MELEDELLDEYDDTLDDTEEERKARADTEVILGKSDQELVNLIVGKMLIVVDELSGHPLYPYQVPFARRLIESLIIGDGATITALWSRQSGKSESIANTVAACMVMFPRLAPVFPHLIGKFKEGLWVGAFAPVGDQAENLYGRIVERLASERATEWLMDPEIDDKVQAGAKVLKLTRCKSFIRMHTAHPRAIIEGRTYHLILLDEAQGLDEKVTNKSIQPMGASTNATTVMTGTPSYEKGVFYKTIQYNKRDGTKRGHRQNHFEADWRIAAKSNQYYKRYVEDKMLKIGEDSDEFKLSYRLMWLLDRGMFTTSEQLEALGDRSMKAIHSWHKSPVVVGIDPARKQDSTIVTVVWVNWDRPDENGYYEHRILNWLDLTGLEWEAQYFRIVEFLSNYHVLYAGVDEGGMGDVVIDRLRTLMPHIEWIPVGSSRPEQSKRWKHLGELIRREKIGWPAHAETRRLKVYRRFIQEMGDMELKYEGPHVLAMAPKEAGAHDDYGDSLSIACILTKEFVLPEVEVSSSGMFYGNSR